MKSFSLLKHHLIVSLIAGAVIWPVAALAHPWGEGSSVQQVQPFGPRLLWNKLADYFQYPIRDFAGPVTVLAVHSSEYWDPDEMIKSPIARLRMYAAKKSIPFHYLVSAQERNMLVRENLGTERLSEALPYEGDSHFYRAAGTIIFAGGNFSQCLCNAVRASIIHAGRRTLDIKLIADAIYEGPFPSTLAPDMIKKMRPGRQTSNRLDQLMAVMSDREFMRYLRQDWIAHDQLPCNVDPPKLQWGSPGGVNLIFKRAGRVIGQVGQGQDADINIEFLTMDELTGEGAVVGH